MNKSIKPEIFFAALDLGLHHFEFHLNNDFFKSMDYEDFISSDILVVIDLDKEELLMTLSVSIKGLVSVECDRCLSSLDIPIDVKDSVIVKEGVDDDSDESIMFISADDVKLDLSPYIYDLVIVSMPVRKIHPDDANGNSTCDQEQLNCLERYTKHDTVDPRWEVLNSLKENSK